MPATMRRTTPPTMTMTTPPTTTMTTTATTTTPTPTTLRRRRWLPSSLGRAAALSSVLLLLLLLPASAEIAAAAAAAAGGGGGRLRSSVAAFAFPPSGGGGRAPAVGSSAAAAAAVRRRSVGSAFLGRGMRLVRADPRRRRGAGAVGRGRRNGSTALTAFLGQDSGILGVGAPEVAVIILVGYFILGPTDLYKLVKEIGKTIQNVRTLGVEASKSFENTMEDQLEIKELRKAQAELTDAFSFRRSINVDDDSYFSEAAEREAAAAAASSAEATGGAAAAGAAATAGAAAAGAPAKRKRVRRRVKRRKVAEEGAAPAVAAAAPATTGGDVPDLDAPEALRPISPEPAAAASTTPPAPAGARVGSADWFQEQKAVPEQLGGTYEAAAAGAGAGAGKTTAEEEPPASAYEQERFAAQLSGSWNDSILANEDGLAPLSKIMERLAILEEEKRAADMRLEEEFRLKAELEEKFYREKRALLEGAAAEAQADAYAGMTAPAPAPSSEKTVAASAREQGPMDAKKDAKKA